MLASACSTDGESHSGAMSIGQPVISMDNSIRCHYMGAFEVSKPSGKSFKLREYI